MLHYLMLHYFNDGLVVVPLYLMLNHLMLCFLTLQYIMLIYHYLMLHFKMEQSLYTQQNKTTPLRGKLHLICNLNVRAYSLFIIIVLL